MTAQFVAACSSNHTRKDYSHKKINGGRLIAEAELRERKTQPAFVFSIKPADNFIYYYYINSAPAQPAWCNTCSCMFQSFDIATRLESSSDVIAMVYIRDK